MVFFKAILMLILPFYRISYHVDKWPEEFEYLSYDYGDVVKQKIIRSNDLEYKKLQSLVIKHSKGWQYSLAKEVPRFHFRSKDLYITCTSADFIHITYFKDGEWITISTKDIDLDCEKSFGVAKPDYDKLSSDILVGMKTLLFEIRKNCGRFPLTSEGLAAVRDPFQFYGKECKKIDPFFLKKFSDKDSQGRWLLYSSDGTHFSLRTIDGKQVSD